MMKQQRMNGTAVILGWAASNLMSGFGAVASAQDATKVACSDWAEAVTVDRHERTLVAGAAADNRILEWEDGHAHYADFALARLLPDGRFDSEFGNAGSLIVDVGDFDSLSAVLPVAGGTLAAGTTAQRAGERSGSRELVLLQVNEEGTLATAFGVGGIARIDVGGSVTVASLAHTWAGGAYVAGTITSDTVLTQGFVVRLDARGALDTSFGEAGIVRFGLDSESVRFHGVRALWDGVLIGGHASSEGHVGALTLRLDARGQPVSEYGSAGIARYDLGGSVANDGVAAVNRLGAAVVALSVTGEGGAARITSVRFDPNGQLVQGDQGDVSILDIPEGSQDSVYAAALRGRSLVLAGGTSPDDSSTGDAYVAHLTPGGELDPESNGGIQTLHLDLEYTSFLGAVVRHGAVTVAGYNFGEEPDTLPPSDALVVRYRRDGSIDDNFGNAGKVLVDFRHGALVCGPRVEVNAADGDDHS